MFGRSFYKQREALALRLDEIIRASLAADRVPAVNSAAEETYGDFAIGKHPEQREMRFFLGDLGAFTPGLINRLRVLVTNEFPKWTVVPQFDTHVFVVTSSCVVFGDAAARSTVTEQTPGYVEWLVAAREYDRKRYGPMRQQFDYLRPRLPTAITAAAERGFAAVAAFDFYAPHFWGGNPVVWVVLNPALSRAEVVPAERLRESAVSASGFVFPRYTQHFEQLSSDPPAAILAAFEFELANRDVLNLVADGTRVLGRLQSPRILSMCDLEGTPEA